MVVGRSRRSFLLVGIWAALACGKAPSPSKDSASTPSLADAGSTSSNPGCRKTGHWSACQVKLRLEQAGVAPRPDSAPPEMPSLGPAPTVYVVGTSALAVYLFADSSRRAHAASTLDTTKFVGPSTALSARGETTAIQNDNLLALLFSRNDHQRERVSDALTAGAPQP